MHHPLPKPQNPPTMPRPRRQPRKRLVLLLSAITAILLSIILLLLSGTFSSPSTPMLNYRNLDVKLMSQDQKDSLLGLKFVDVADPSTASIPGAIARSQLPENSRVIPQGYFVTMDYQEDRLNLYLDAEGKVKKVKTG